MQTVYTSLPDVESTPETCPDGPTWVWWYVNMLPMTPEIKLEFLKCDSLRERLLMLKRTLSPPSESH